MKKWLKVVLIILGIFLVIGGCNNLINEKEKTKISDNTITEKQQNIQENVISKVEEEKITQKENECPDFSSLSDRVSCGTESCDFTILNLPNEKVAQVGEYKLYPLDATPGEFYPYATVIAPCRKGSEKGENANYFYCEGMYTIIKETDSLGNILSSKKSMVTLVISNSKIINSICE